MSVLIGIIFVSLGYVIYNKKIERIFNINKENVGEILYYELPLIYGL